MTPFLFGYSSSCTESLNQIKSWLQSMEPKVEGNVAVTMLHLQRVVQWAAKKEDHQRCEVKAHTRGCLSYSGLVKKNHGGA